MMKFLLLLWILVKSTFTSFAGLASLPEIREELVEQRHWLTDDDLNQAVVISRTTPGPVGVYVVSVGYIADGIPGAVAGWIAMASPSLLVILLVGYFGKRAQHPRVRAMLQCVVLASAALLVLAAIPLGRQALDGPLTIAITAVALPLLITKRVNTLWIIGVAAALSFTGSVTGLAGSRGSQRELPALAGHAARQERLAGDAGGAAKPVGGVQRARSGEVAGRVEHDAAITAAPRMVDHAADQAPAEPAAARIRLDEQEPQLRGRIRQPLARDRSDEPAAELGDEDPVARRREAGREVGECLDDVALEHRRIAELGNIELAVARDDVADLSRPRRADRDPVAAGAVHRREPTDHAIDRRPRLAGEPPAEPSVGPHIQRGDLSPALARHSDRSRAAVAAIDALDHEAARGEPRHRTTDIAKIEIEPPGEP